MTSPADDATVGSSGAVLKTLLLSDIVGSTKLVERLGDERTFEIFGRHDRVARDLLRQFDGREIDKTDGFLMLFERPIDAVGYALAYHGALASLSEELGVEVTSRVGIHLGEVYLRENPPEDVARGAKPLEVEGLAKPVAARLMSLAMGAQTLLTRGAFDLARRAAVGKGVGPGELQWMAHGAYLFKGVDEPTRVFEVGVEGLSPLAPPPDSAKVTRVVGDETILGWRPAPGQEVPRRPNWVLERKLGEGGFGEVWLAEHAKTRDTHVLKFCFDVERLKGLQREVTLIRLLKEALGNRDDIARILDWNFDEAPYFVESEYTEGGSIVDWAKTHGGIEEMPLEQRLELVAQVAEALAAAHSVGVLHKDLKPANVLVHTGPDGVPKARLTDFGIGLVTDRERLADVGFTVLGFTETMLADGASTVGTQLYMAPELLEGKVPTVQADIYALGVVLYQLVVADLKRALAPGWERHVEDELLRSDIAAMVDGSPERRMSDAGEASRRLRRLDERRAERVAAERARIEAAQARAALERARKRRKLVTAVVVSLTVFAAAMGVQSWRIAREAERAERAAERAEQEAETARRVSSFLVGLFDEANPEQARGREITVREVVDRGADKIDQELADEPVHRSRLKQTLGKVYFKLGIYDRAETLFAEGVELQRQHGDRVDLDVATSLMGLANVLMTQGRVDEVGPMLEQALAIKEEALGPEHEEVGALLSNLSRLNRFQGRYEEALRLAERALGVYEAVHGRDAEMVAKLLVNVGNSYGDVGRYDEAEAAFARALEIFEEAGEDHPEIARVLASLAKVYQVREKHDDAELLLRRALTIREKVLGEDHPLVASTLRRLGDVRCRQGALAEARELLQRSLSIAETRMGPNHQLVAEVLAPLAELERRERSYDRAEQHANRAFEIVGARQGPDHPGVCPALQVLGAVSHDSGRLAEAADLLERAVEIRLEAKGENDPLLGVLLHRLAMVYRDQARPAEARSALERALANREGLLGADHPAVGEIREAIAAL